MSELTPQMEAALASGRALVLAFCRMDLTDGRTIRLLTGSGEVPWDGGTFLGTDPTFGSILALQPPSDGFGDEAPGMSFVLSPPTVAAATDLAAPAMQTSRCRWWIACLDDNGGVIASPWLWFDGFLDQPTLSNDLRELDLSVVSEMEKLFLSEEGRRLSNPSHTEIWPGETGMQYVTGLSRTIIWGPGDRPAGISYGTTSSPGEGYGGGSLPAWKLGGDYSMVDYQ